MLRYNKQKSPLIMGYSYFKIPRKSSYDGFENSMNYVITRQLKDTFIELVKV
jgi:hypothetical protein